MKNLASLASIVAAVILASGCSTYRPHTNSEKLWFGACIAGQAADVITTKYGLDNGLEETNPLVGEDPKMQDLILGKVALTGFIYGLGQIFPEHRKTFYKIGAFMGGGLAGYNYYLTETKR